VIQVVLIETMNVSIYQLPKRNGRSVENREYIFIHMFISYVNVLRIKVHLFNWKQYNPTSKEVIERENLRLCRLEYILCKRSITNVYELVSPPSYTSVIEQSNVCSSQ
jgi:hypothetical protein